MRCQKGQILGQSSTRLHGVIAALRTSHPDVDLHLYAAGTAECVDGLRSGRLDVALRNRPTSPM
ncbi:LysR substrate-binding domain-containing protein [Streptomyces malaysiensis]|uniref:LysR substrate-binding domain-containing protein n=1 Tax=Streptomyces malaysiensis TaxID=92644 RepID=UPI00274072C7|nr:LysR substrate-binding domain-containing protein [Streptomyces samsunensis]